MQTVDDISQEDIFHIAFIRDSKLVGDTFIDEYYPPVPFQIKKTFNNERLEVELLEDQPNATEMRQFQCYPSRTYVIWNYAWVNGKKVSIMDYLRAGKDIPRYVSVHAARNTENQQPFMGRLYGKSYGAEEKKIE